MELNEMGWNKLEWCGAGPRYSIENIFFIYTALYRELVECRRTIEKKGNLYRIFMDASMLERVP